MVRVADPILCLSAKRAADWWTASARWEGQLPNERTSRPKLPVRQSKSCGVENKQYRLAAVGITAVGGVRWEETRRTMEGTRKENLRWAASSKKGENGAGSWERQGLSNFNVVKVQAPSHFHENDWDRSPAVVKGFAVKPQLRLDNWGERLGPWGLH